MIKHPKYDRGTLYLSGGMQHADNLGLGWRTTCSERLRKMKYFPLNITELDINYSKNHGELYYMEKGADHLLNKANIRKHFVFADLQLITNDSDALIVYYDKSARTGAGTISECQVAYNNDIPIFLVSAWEDWETEVPGWLQALTTKIVTSFDQLYEYLDKLPYGIIKKDIYKNRSCGVHYLCSLCGDPFLKNKHHFVSHVSPLYCSPCVDVITEANETNKDRYTFFVEYFENYES